MPELDFVLEMAAIDEPEKWTFNRHGEPKARSESLAGWNDRLAGRALMRMMARTGISIASAGVARWRARQSGGMKPGLTRGGKKINVYDRSGKLFTEEQIRQLLEKSETGNAGG